MKNKLTCILFFAVIFIFSLLCFLLPKDDFSESERRVLARFPTLSAESIFSGDFSEGFEEYATDSFPFRDTFRAIKAHSATKLFLTLDNNKFFAKDGHLSKIEYPLNEKLLAHATERFEFLRKTYLEGQTDNIYLSIIPDKNYFIAPLKLDYEKLTQTVRDAMPYAEYIDIFPLLSISDYYTTDSHWKQECITDVAETLLSAMGKKQTSTFTEAVVSTPFYGVYSGQAAISFPPDTIRYLTSESHAFLTVTNYDSGQAAEGAVYDLSKFHATEEHPRDMYEMFLSGNSALLTIENSAKSDGSHLVVFRDSFASSLLPLMVAEYEKVTVCDIRYIPSEMIGHFVSDFEEADVLFLYSASMLNSSGGMK